APATSKTAAVAAATYSGGIVSRNCSTSLITRVPAMPSACGLASYAKPQAEEMGSNGGRLADERALLQVKHALGAGRRTRVVRHHQDRLVEPPLQLDDQIEDLLRRTGVEIAGR